MCAETPAQAAQSEQLAVSGKPEGEKAVLTVIPMGCVSRSAKPQCRVGHSESYSDADAQENP